MIEVSWLPRVLPLTIGNQIPVAVPEDFQEAIYLLATVKAKMAKKQDASYVADLYASKLHKMRRRLDRSLTGSGTASRLGSSRRLGG